MINNNLKLHSIKGFYFWLLITFVFLCLESQQANAQPRGLDSFSVNSAARTSSLHKGSINTSATRSSSDNTAIAAWFSKYDQIREQYRPTEKDKVILTRPLMQQAERVQQWTNTASKVAKNYSLAAKSIRALVVPPGLSDVKEYRDLMADWYEDAGSVYRDLIRPRPAAKTIEDLQEQLDAIKKRSEGLANNIANLKNMDRDLRQHYNVQPALQDDAIQQFVRSK